MYNLEITPNCKKSIEKACSKNPVLQKILKKKVSEILENPSRFKMLIHDLKGERRVHLMKSFVLRFIVDDLRKTVILIDFDHHDNAYKR